MLRYLFFSLIVRPLVLIILGMNVRHRERLPKKGPAIIVANHNSHLDTIVLMSLFPLKLLPKIRPVAALDYFLKNKFLSWFSTNIIRIIPIQRKGLPDPATIFLETKNWLADNNIIILFPEGSRGEPEQRTHFKSGIARLVEQCPDIPLIPIFLHGLGKALPKNDWVLVPFFCDIFIGEKLPWTGDKKIFIAQIEERMNSLSEEGQFSVWD